MNSIPGMLFCRIKYQLQIGMRYLMLWCYDRKSTVDANQKCSKLTKNREVQKASGHHNWQRNDFFFSSISNSKYNCLHWVVQSILQSTTVLREKEKSPHYFVVLEGLLTRSTYFCNNYDYISTCMYHWCLLIAHSPCIW